VADRPPLAAALSRLPAGEEAGLEIHELMRELFPLCRSLTGPGVRRTLEILAEKVPLEVTEVASGTPVLDWTVPPEWSIEDAWIADADGRRLVDFRESSLHVVSYSAPVRGRFGFDEIRDRLFTLPDRPTLVPYRTSYWSETWGFCLAHERLADLERAGELEVVIESRLAPGHLVYGEVVVPGETPEEVLLSTHICHPSLANDNLSGIALLATLARRVAETRPRLTHRFLFSPGTIGPVTWLARNAESLQRIKHGMVVVCVGDPGPLTYKRSRRGRAAVDRAAAHVLAHRGNGASVRDFEPWGSDQRQFCSPGFDLPVGCLMRTPPGEFPENHTSADDLSFVTPAALADSLKACLEILAILDQDRTVVNLSPYGEPQLGRRGLFRSAGGAGVRAEAGLPDERALLWVLNLADGRHSLLDIAERSGMRFDVVQFAAQALEDAGLVEECDGPSPAHDGSPSASTPEAAA
jgi:aminopeptidase-like protein